MTTLDWLILLSLLPILLLAVVAFLSLAAAGAINGTEDLLFTFTRIRQGIPRAISGPYMLYAAFALSYVFGGHLASGLQIGLLGKLVWSGIILCLAVRGLIEIREIFQQHQTNSILKKYVAETRQQDIVDTLLQDMKEREVLGETALMWAASRGHVDIVRMLLDKGADPEERDKSGNTALTLTVISKYTDDATKQVIIDLLQGTSVK